MRTARPLLSCLALLAACAGALAAEDSAEQINKLIQAHHYGDAAAMAQRMLDANPKDQDAAYNLACALAREGRRSPALDALAKAAALGWADSDHAKVDDDLASLHGQARFTAIIADMQKQSDAAHAKDVQGIPYEAGDALAGIKVVEGDPASGLRWRLRIAPEADGKHKAALVIWLHPSGASMDGQVEPLSMDLAKHHCALLVFTQKQYREWTPAEMNKLGSTIDDVGRQAPVDAAHPILMGFSAGGQAALMLWSSNPAPWKGLMLDAAYPIDPSTMKGNSVTSIPLTPAMKAAKTPMIALVGGKDGGSVLWKAIGPLWQQNGIPVELHIVPDRVHEFLFKGAEWKATLDWLDVLNQHGGKAEGAAHGDGGDVPVTP